LPNRTVAFKRESAVAACAPGISVARLALARGLNTNLLFKWRRFYRAGKYGAPDPAHLPRPVAKATTPAKAMETTVTLLPVELPDRPGREARAVACIEVAFACATLRIHGQPEARVLGTIFELLARHR